MTEQQIRDHIESLADPVTFDEIVDTSVVTRVVSASSKHRVRPWAIAAVLVAVLGLGGLVVIASRETDSAASVAVQTLGLELTPNNPEVGTSFVATVTGDNLEDLTMRAEAYIEQLTGDSWQRIWLVYPVFVDATASPADPVDLTGGSASPTVSPIRLVATRPLRVVLPRQLAAGSYRFCLQADVAGSSAADGELCAPIVVGNAASPPTSVQTAESVPSQVGATSIGVEEPLVEIAITDVQDVAKPGSAHAFGVEGHPPVVLWTTGPFDHLAIHFVRIVEDLFLIDGEHLAILDDQSSIDNHVASDDLFTWSNLPPEVDTVRYDDGTTRLWQRPVAGLAIFRVDPDHPHPDITAYDATGATLPYSFWGQNPPTSLTTEPPDASVTVQPADPAAIANMNGELQSLTQSSAHDCLTANGASWTVANVPTFSAGADPGAIWNNCVLQVQAIVAARQTELSKGP